MSSAVSWLVVLSIIHEYGSLKSERILSCWTVNVTEDKKSYLYYYRGDPARFVQDLITRTSSPAISSVGFNSAAYVLGAVAADNDDPISLFVHDKISGNIYRFDDNLRSFSPLFKGTSKQVEDIAVDWLSHNVYYTDPLLGVGLVSYTKHFTIIIHKVAALHGIDIDPLSRLLFYADGSTGHIYQASLTGENHRALSGSQTTNPTALVADAKTKRLFWLDEGTQYLQSWNYATSEFQKLWNSYKVGVGVFTGIDLYEPYLFVSLKNEQRMKVIRTNGTEVLSFSPSNGTGSRSYGISISTPSRKPHVSSHCADNNGGCQHICVHASNINSDCLCQFGYTSDGNFCKSEVVLDHFLMFTDSSSDTIYQVNTKTHEFHRFYTSSTPYTSPQVVAFDPQEKNVYWTDVNKHKIWTRNLLGHNVDLFLGLSSTSSISSMAVDSSSRCLYYTDTELRRIGKIDLNTKRRAVVLQLTIDEKPAQIQLDSDRRQMYWIDGGRNPKIERADMDNGMNRKLLISDRLQKPSGLALDLSGHYIYWVDELLRKIERSKMDGSVRELFIVTPSNYKGLTLDEAFLYLIKDRSLVKIGKAERNLEQLGPEYFLVSGLLCYSSSLHDYEGRGQSMSTISQNKIIIIGVVVGGAILLAIITAVVCISRKRQNNRSELRSPDRTRAVSTRLDNGQDNYEVIDASSLQENTANYFRRDSNPDTRQLPEIPRFNYTRQKVDDVAEYLTMKRLDV